MATPKSRTLAAHCSLEGATLNISYESSKVANRLRRELERRLGKKGVALAWQDQPQASEVRIRFVRIDQGNQFLRWLLPFVAPAVVEIEGEINASGRTAKPFHYIRKTHFAMFGGAAKYMVGVCADRLAGDLTKEILRMVA